MRIPAYPHIIHIGERGTDTLLVGDVYVEEKYDGSQFRIGYTNADGIILGSHKQDIDAFNRPKMFEKGIEYAETLGDKMKYLMESFNGAVGVFAYCEYFAGPRQNTLVYSKIPQNHLMLFDFLVIFNDFSEYWVNPNNLRGFADDLGISCASVLGVYNNPPIDILMDAKWFDQNSSLGGPTVEGVVFKNYDQLSTYNNRAQPTFAKFVSKQFKEKNDKSWSDAKPLNGADAIVARYKGVEARWKKSIQHAAEQGLLTFQPKDIGMLCKMIVDDVVDEEKEAIKEALWKVFNSSIAKAAVAGFAEYYKEKLNEIREQYDNLGN